METILVKRRIKDTSDPTENVLMEFVSISHASQWMEEENLKDDRIYDIAAVTFAPKNIDIISILV